MTNNESHARPKQMSKRILLLYILSSLQALALFFLVFQVFLFSFSNFDEGFGKGLQDSFCNYVGIDRIEQFGPEEAGYVIGSAMLPLPFLLVAIFGIYKRRRVIVVVSHLLLMLFIVGQGGIPVLPIVCLVLLFIPRSSRVWRKKEADGLPED